MVKQHFYREYRQRTLAEDELKGSISSTESYCRLDYTFISNWHLHD